jgi:hypothetical protein
MIRANAQGEAEIICGLAAIYDAHGRVFHLKHSDPTPQIITADQRRAAKAKRKAQRAARKRSRP